MSAPSRSHGTTEHADPKKVPIRDFRRPHREFACQATRNILSSDIAESTFGQIIDGIPLSQVALDCYHGATCPGHPLLDEHFQLSPSVLQLARRLRDEFDPDDLHVDHMLSHAFQAANRRSGAFNTRLIELAAVAVHSIAVSLFKKGPARPATDRLLSWKTDKEVYPPTFFRHEWYTCHEQYPDGVADMVGYWAESRIFGGVVLFDRREPGSTAGVDVSLARLPQRTHSILTFLPLQKPDAIYFHSDNRDVTCRIYRLLDGQKQQLLEFLLSYRTPPSDCPLPIHGDRNNRTRIDAEEPIAETGIYRDKWERAPLGPDDYDIRLKDVMDLFNYLSEEEFFDAAHRAFDLRERRRRGDYLGF